MTKILVAYASKHNATAEIAAAISDVLRRFHVLQIDLLSVDVVRDITAYDAVVLGSAVYADQWRPAAVAFLLEHERALTQRPVWLFSSGPTGEGDLATLTTGGGLPESLKSVVVNIAPRDIALFHGKFDPAALNVYERFLLSGKTDLGTDMLTGDFRNWQRIGGWAYGIAQTLISEVVCLQSGR